VCANCHRFDRNAGQQRLAELPLEHRALLENLSLSTLASGKGAPPGEHVDVPKDLGLCRGGGLHSAELVSPAFSCSAFVPKERP
jgi:hypothetical protein